MILSVSRRTDVPAFYMDWFLNRLREGQVLMKNPMNLNQVGRIRLNPSTVDCIIFWTKNPGPMIETLGLGTPECERTKEQREAFELLRPYEYYVQFTLNDYGEEIEGGLPPLEERIEQFRILSEAIGSERVLWRYDPIVMGGEQEYGVDYHAERFAKLAEALNGYTKRCTISFLDLYWKTRKTMERLGIRPPGPEEIRALAERFSATAEGKFRLYTCAEHADLSEFGIGHGACIDQTLIEQLLGCRLSVRPDRYQRQDCGCISSVDVGTYNTCGHCCSYCYANYSTKSVTRNMGKYDPSAQILCDAVAEGAEIREREMKSLKNAQLDFSWDSASTPEIKKSKSRAVKSKLKQKE